jgi:hypothetical protein
MDKSLYFFLIFLATIIITRIFVYIKPIASPTINGLRLHHYMYGLILLVLSLFVKNILIYAIGLGLFLDELAYILIGGKNRFQAQEYTAWK